MEIKIWRRIYITPWIRLNLYTRGFSLRFGHRSLGWITLGRRGVRGTLDTPLPGVYLSEERTWKELGKSRTR